MPDHSLADFSGLDDRGRSRAIVYQAAFAPAWARILFPRKFEGTWSPTDMQVLITVRRGKEGTTTEEIASHLVLNRPAVTNACQKLGDANMLASEHDPSGRSNRAQRWKITRKGTALYKRWGETAYERWSEYTVGMTLDSAYRGGSG